ncbi:MAG: hypothetical protein GY749_48640 [Desulfobacteraceae bacterium]|nr:hypothetical protein [Desulfobacteraceae bacterium]
MSVCKYLYHKCINSSQRWYPMLSVYYLTYACNFRCPYCSDGTGKPYYKLSSPVLPGTSVISLLKIIRRHCDYIVITGVNLSGILIFLM